MARLAVAHPDRDGALRRRILQSVVEKLPESQAHQPLIESDFDGSGIAGHLQRPITDLGLHRGHGLPDDLRGARLFQVEVDVGVVQPRHFDGVVDQLFQVLGFLVGDGEKFGPVLGGLAR